MAGPSAVLPENRAQLLELLKQSRLLAPEQFAAARAETTNDGEPRSLARAWVKRNLLSRWQAQQLLAGRHQLLIDERYQLVERIGRGGMASVYRAIDTKRGRTVALKILSKQRLKDPHTLARFRREVQLAAALSHPNIASAIDAGSVGQTHYLVMEYVDGRDLGAWLDEFGQLPIDWSCECIRQAALGLEYGHGCGLVHRDIKPDNILVAAGTLERPPVIKLLDLGLARMDGSEPDVETDQTRMTQTGQIMGTPDYIAPEQAKNTKGADIRADIFSLGCTLFKLITGQVPFGGNNAMEKLAARFADEPPLASSIRPEVPLPLDLVLKRMLARDPDQRYQTPGEVAEALAPFALTDGAHDSALALPAMIPETSTIEADEDPTLRDYFNQLAMVEKRDRLRRTQRSRRLQGWLIGLALLLAVLGAAGWKWRSELGLDLLWLRLTQQDPGLVWRWQSASAPNLVFDPASGEAIPCRVEPRGDVLFDDGQLLCDGGSLLAIDADARLLAACLQTQELAIEAMVAPASLSQRGPARIITYSSGSDSRNFTLGQRGRQLVLRLRTSETGPNGMPPEIELFELDATGPRHVIVTFRPGELVCYVDGQQVHRSAPGGDLSSWTPQHLVLGDEYDGGRAWYGALWGVGIFNRYLHAQEAQRRYRDHH